MVSLVAAVYLLLRRGNAIAPGVTPPVRLRRWAAAFFGVVALAHLWWLYIYFFLSDLQSPAYTLTVMFDCVTLLTTTAGTLLSMLQDRRRPVWRVVVAMVPFVVFLGGISGLSQ